jgi:hypothetical protein
MKKMKKIIVSFLIVATFLTVLSSFAFAKSAGSVTNNNTAITKNAADSFSDVFCIDGNETRWHKIYFTAGSYVDIEIEGDGITDLDLYVYDSNQRKIVGKTGSGDYETAELEIYQSGYLWIAVTNRGSFHNDYVLTVLEY